MTSHVVGLPLGQGSFNVQGVRRSFVLAVFGLVVVVVATSGIAALPWASNSGCADSFGTGDADVSLQLVPFGLVCDYHGDLTGPAEAIVRAPSVPVFVAWLLFVGTVVSVSLRRRAVPGARGLVSGVCGDRDGLQPRPDDRADTTHGATRAYSPARGRSSC